ncbi:pentatricopeptide repeat-containing protein ELI1, chloroplastic-like [Cicer arietinum]|uniref:pentatricopeptide repeat-containing protein ELI1, chloroplastic-like n=1 Tax=Cicer arietinum TaxID=3827 RepID=UPI003CC68E50
MALREGLEVHCVVLKNGFCVNLYVGTSLVEMFVRSLVSWTAVIVGFARCGDMSEARKLFDVMPDRDIVASNVMIDGYVKMGCMDLARDLFDKMKDKNVISWTSMVHGYCEDDDVVAARFMFDCMPVKNVLSWNAMIRGYCENRRPHDALKLFWKMRGRLDVEMNKVTVVSVLPAVADLSSLDLGVWIHGFVQRNRLDEDVHVYALVDMYAKCGEIGKAKLLFEEMNEKDTSSWNALINGYGVNGCAKEALEVFAAMLREGFEPNEITMTSVLSAYHCGLVEEGRRCFKEMERFGIVPQIEHYGCMIDLLGRVGYLDEAENLIFCVVALSVASSV